MIQKLGKLKRCYPQNNKSITNYKQKVKDKTIDRWINLRIQQKTKKKLIIEGNILIHEDLREFGKMTQCEFICTVSIIYHYIPYKEKIKV